MSLQSFLLFIVYLAILITVARLVDIARWCVMPRPFDPLTMSAVKLKAILEWRGIRTGPAAKKSDLTHLVTQSGSINKVEESVLQQLEDNPGPGVVFTSLNQYNRVVENLNNTNKGAWLVLVKPAIDTCSAESDTVPCSRKHWTSFRRSLGRLGVQTGVLDCKLDSKRCKKRQWTTARLVLAFPVAHDEKIATYEYEGEFLEGDIKDWIRRKLHFRLFYIKDMLLFKAFLKFERPRRDSDVRVVLATHQDSIPIQLFALRVQALRRVEVGVMRDTQGLFMKWIKDNNFGAEISLPLLLFLTREGMYIYGQKAGECLEKSCFEAFLMSWYPNSDQIIFTTVALPFMLTLFDALPVESGPFDQNLILVNKMKNFIVVIGIWILSWYKLSVIHRVTTCSFASVFCRDFMFYSHHPLLFVIVSVLAFVLLHIIAKVCGFRSPVYETPQQAAHERPRRDSSHVTIRSVDSLHIPPSGVAFSPENAHNRPQPGESEDRIQAQPEYVKRFHPNKRHFPPGHMWIYEPDKEDNGAGNGESYIGCSKCSICLSKVKRGGTLRGLSCKHAFHDTCIKEWLPIGKHRCPICRRETF